MDPFEDRLKSLKLWAPSESFGRPGTLVEMLENAPQQKQSLLQRMPWAARAAALLGLAASALVAYIVLSAPASSIALAQVVNKLITAKTMSCNMSVESVGSSGFSCDGEMMFDEANNVRIRMIVDFLNQKTEAMGVFSLSSDKSVVMIPSEKLAITDVLKVGNPNVLKQTIYERFKTLSKESTRSLGHKQIDDIDCEGFEINRKLPMRLWANAKTGDPVRLEMENYPLPAPVGKGNIVVDHFKIDEKIDPALFSVETPEGYTVMKSPMVVDLTGGVTKDIVTLLGIYADQPGEKFPERLLNADDPIFKKLNTFGDPDEKATPENLKVGIAQGSTIPAIRMYLTSHTQGVDYEYIPGGKLGEKDRIVFWYRDDKTGEYSAVYGDLRIETIDKSQLPNSGEKGQK
jgi:outer membrane lipoprotein-sorting protein